MNAPLLVDNCLVRLVGQGRGIRLVSYAEAAWVGISNGSSALPP